MKRFHVHVSVDDLDQSLKFYSALFGQAPTIAKPDYAKWRLEDPRVNFAISARGGESGIDHLGFQVDDEADLELMHTQLQQAGKAIIAEPGTTCCYAKSDKYWVQDPTGIAWETFRSLGSIPTFKEVSASSPELQQETPAVACCAPKCCG